MGGCGSRSPRSRTEEISLAGMPSYGFNPNVISSHTVTPVIRLILLSKYVLKFVSFQLYLILNLILHKNNNKQRK